MDNLSVSENIWLGFQPMDSFRDLEYMTGIILPPVLVQLP